MKKDPARIDRLFAAARLAIRDEQVAASAAKDDAPPSDEHGGKTLSEEEFAAAVAAELNAVRTNPQSYIPYLEAMLTQFSGNILTIPSEGIRLQTEEGPTAVQDCLVFLKAHQPVDYLVLEPNMSKAAVDHALDLGNNGAVSHTGSDGSTMVGRLEHYGEWKGSIGELLAFGLCRPRNVVLQLLVDDGVPTRGDRMSLMDNKFKSVGVGFHTHKFQKFVCVLDFAGGFGALGTSCSGCTRAPPSFCRRMRYSETMIPTTIDLCSGQAHDGQARARAGGNHVGRRARPPEHPV
ncbi:hypothetical protein, variant 7 [Aphanomyces astaci]|nr:hypothetical protein, variant 6 [Aphanomyces astaci]XP_009843034.1 hypothetical protein, variant 7 [Aphanomyces astaci]ETV67476.1 hypothetical protein, variant 6 [Aphanomyces astaci]ETV67477.1 hypothetical protein, variant 7 [Aphanomyces astaci]|eukprot:XP_009843033.1 hypothetical protein, variant 6 [Aphanomyces astaci]